MDNKTRRRVGVAVALGGVLLSTMAAANAELLYEREHEGTWSSFFVDTDAGGEGRGWVSGEGEGVSSLRVDFLAGSCDWDFRFSVHNYARYLPEPNKDDRGRVQVRVDRREIHAGEAIYREFPSPADSPMTAIYVRFDDPSGVIEDLRNGHTVRVRVIGANNTWVAAFPLAGSHAALVRARSLCREHGREDEDYFEDAPDEDYFQDSGGQDV